MLRAALVLALIPLAAAAEPPASQTQPAPPSTQKPAPAATPPARGSQPASSTAKPVPATARPSTTTARPGTTTAKPATGVARPPAATTKPAAAPMTDDQKTIYALGLLMQRSLGAFDLSAPELEIVKRALGDAAAGKPAVELDEWGPKIDPLARIRRERVAVREKAAATAYLAKSAGEPGAVKTDSGLVYREQVAGTGAAPVASDRVRVHYRGTLINGTEFDSSYKRNEPTEFALGGVVPCWTEGVQRMKAGGKSRLVCPSALAYGDNGAPGIPGGAALIFEIELLEVIGR